MTTELGLYDKVAIVTGAGRGIGQAIAQLFAAVGAKLVLAARTQNELEDVAEALRRSGASAEAVPTDIRESAQVQRLVDRCLEIHGQVDVLVCNAGISPIYTRAENIREADWQAIMAVNLNGTALCCLKAGRAMLERGRGSIINMVSVGASVGLPRLAAYCAAKGGVEQLTKVLALEWADRGVRVNAVGPAYVETDFTRGLRENDHLRAEILAATPMQRFGRPAEIAGAVLYLASDLGSYTTGQTIYVDGGWTAR